MWKFLGLGLLALISMSGVNANAVGSAESKLVFGKYHCEIEGHGKFFVTIDDKGFFNAGPFGAYWINRDLSQTLMRPLKAENLGRFPVRDHYFSSSEPEGTITVGLAPSKFWSGRQRVQLDVRANRNSVRLNNCVLVQ